MVTTFITDYQTDPYTITIVSASQASDILVNDQQIDKSEKLTCYIPALTGTGVDVQVMATSGSAWVNLEDEGGTLVNIPPSVARNFKTVAAYGYRFNSDAPEAADRVITVIGAFQVTLTGLA
jgi:hypothetical protein